MAVLFDNRYELLHNIGNESYGEVWLAKDIYTKEKVTIKIYVLSRLSLSPQNRPSARELIEISGIMLSPNLWTNIICYCEKAWTKIFSNKYRSCARHELRV